MTPLPPIPVDYPTHPSPNWRLLGRPARVYYYLRSIVLWTMSVLHFFPLCSALVALGAFIDPRKNDRPQRWLFRNILRMVRVDFEVNYAPGFDRTRTSFFVCNHVDIFDAFIIYSSIPQFVRGLEHESHFKIPAYGWMMRRFGNVPVPPEGNLADYKRMMKLTKETLAGGVSLIVFAEGSRTKTGFVGPFNPGVFRMAIQFGYPVVPMSIVGAYEFSRKGDWKLFPSKITVHLHDTIDTRGMSKEDVTRLQEKVHAVVAAPVNAYYGVEPVETLAQQSLANSSQASG